MIPVLITHRFFARSIVSPVMPVQRREIALKRGALDNLLSSEQHSDGSCQRHGKPEHAGQPTGVTARISPHRSIQRFNISMPSWKAELAKLRADLDAKLQILDAHINASTAERQPPSVPGARKAKDGHHYMSDAKRPGKFLMVVPYG